LKAETLPFRKGSLRIAAKVVKGGGVIAFPTDTVYGLGCDPFNESAVRRLFDIKDRVSKAIPVLCKDKTAAHGLVELNTRATELAEKHWPGALTIVAPLKVKVPELLDQASGWLGVRVPAGSECLALLRVVGGYLTGTSANISGKPSCRSAGEVRRSLGERVDLILDGGTLDAPESTVVKIDGEDVEVLRRGNIGLESGKRRARR
jgi:L-threonylcarbamoyladenylate synthase